MFSSLLLQSAKLTEIKLLTCSRFHRRTRFLIRSKCFRFAARFAKLVESVETIIESASHLALCECATPDYYFNRGCYNPPSPFAPTPALQSASMSLPQSSVCRAKLDTFDSIDARVVERGNTQINDIVPGFEVSHVY